MSPKTLSVVLGVMFLFPSISVATELPETLLVQRLLGSPQLKEEMIASAEERNVGHTLQGAARLYREDPTLPAADR